MPAKRKYDDFFDFSVKNVAKCKLCDKVMKTSNSTSGLKYHMEKIHSTVSMEQTSNNDEPEKRGQKSPLRDILTNPRLRIWWPGKPH